MPWDLTDDKSTLVQVMACCRQATSHYPSQYWPRSLSPHGVTRPQCAKISDIFLKSQWVNLLLPSDAIWHQDILVNIGSGNGLSPVQWKAITWIIVDLLSIWPYKKINFCKIWQGVTLTLAQWRWPKASIIFCQGQLTKKTKTKKWFGILTHCGHLWLSDAMWWHRSWSTLAQVVACCLTAPSHYLKPMLTYRKY